MLESNSTVMIPDLSNEHFVAEAQAYFDKRMRFNPDRKPDFFYRGAPVYMFGDGEQKSYIFLVENGEVIYLLKYHKVRYSGVKLGRQVLVVRARMTTATNQFARHVFFKILLPKYGALIADKQQTKFGRNFWEHAITDAINQNLHVYFLDRRSAPNVLHEIKSDSDVEKFSPDIWGNSKGHELTFAVISQTKLHLISRKSKKK